MIPFQPPKKKPGKPFNWLDSLLRWSLSAIVPNAGLAGAFYWLGFELISVVLVLMATAASIILFVGKAIGHMRWTTETMRESTI